MADLINLRHRRKEAARRQAEGQAAENRARFGRPKADRLREKAETGKAQRDLSGKKLD
ncbi:MAG TPA: DUF4169 family protein [Stellaceae bacterium]|jgi:hypothetical protein|nr:DUF4169 family protein [Stellaceae bacterium]